MLTLLKARTSTRRSTTSPGTTASSAQYAEPSLHLRGHSDEPRPIAALGQHYGVSVRGWMRSSVWRASSTAPTTGAAGRTPEKLGIDRQRRRINAVCDGRKSVAGKRKRRRACEGQRMWSWMGQMGADTEYGSALICFARCRILGSLSQTPARQPSSVITVSGERSTASRC